jgi:cyanophycin synthetase
MRQYDRVVVKPLGNTGGVGITTGVDTKKLLVTAFERARASSTLSDRRRSAIFQQHVEGNDCRIIVVDQQRVFAIQRIPAHIIGDGQETTAALVAAWNATRPPECAIELNAAAHELLVAQGLTESSVPPPGQQVRLAYVSNYHAGGKLRDITDELGQNIVATAKAVARYFAVPIVGIDFITPDHRTTVGVIVELNSTPDITIHHQPDEGEPRDVASVILDMLFPETAK